jgi:hypothetical protein
VGQGQPDNPNPQLGVMAQAPVTVAPGAVVQYVLTVTDMDTWKDHYGRLYQMYDYTVALQVVKVNSMTQHSVTCRGVDQSTGKYTYDVVGYAVTTTGIYADNFIGKDTPGNPLLNDVDVPFSQTVIVSSP